MDAAAEVACWVLRPEDLPFVLPPAIDRLRARGRRSTAAADRYLRSRTVLRAVLGPLLDLPPGRVPLRDRVGAPPVVEGYPRLQVSLAHSGEHVAVAVARDTPIGLDIEEVRGRRVPATALDGAKVAALAPLVGGTLAPLAVWVVQEAALKADGRGLTIPLVRVRLEATHAGAAVWVPGTPTPWGVAVARPAGVTLAAVAAPGRVPRVVWSTSLVSAPLEVIGDGPGTGATVG